MKLKIIQQKLDSQLSEVQKKELKKQGYRLVGNHSAVINLFFMGFDLTSAFR